MQQDTLQHAEVGLYHFLLKLLDWPFLLFFVLCLFLVFFRKQIISILSRGDILLSWGDRSIRLGDLSDNLDKELDPLREEIEALKKSIGTIQPSLGTQTSKLLEPPGVTPSTVQLEDAKRRIMDALNSGKYRWRSVERLATVGGIPENHALDLLRSNPEVLLSIGKSGRQIARLKSR